MHDLKLPNLSNFLAENVLAVKEISIAFEIGAVRLLRYSVSHGDIRRIYLRFLLCNFAIFYDKFSFRVC